MHIVRGLLIFDMVQIACGLPCRGAVGRTLSRCIYKTPFILQLLQAMLVQIGLCWFLLLHLELHGRATSSSS